MFKAVKNSARDLYFLLEKIGPIKVAVILFLTLAFVILVFERPGVGNREKYFIPPMDLEQVEGVDLIMSGEGPTVALKKESGQWSVFQEGNLIPADIASVQKLLQALDDLKEVEIVSKNPQNQALYGVDPDKGVEIRVTQKGRVIADFFAGMPETLKKQFVRKNKTDTVIEAVPAFQSLILQPNQWAVK